MYEKIGNVNLNLTYYVGKDLYSDGEIEDELLDIVENNDDFQNIIAKDNRWPILYHLSDVRQNIVNWYPFEGTAEVLEIGAGCGAITGALCKKVKKLSCVELSKKRSQINAHRNKEHSNLEIIVGNFNDIEINEKFDYITLIGVLEYAKSYTDTITPYEDFLHKIKKMLKPSGKLIIAIENRFGLKYWAGCKEDHTKELFDGLNNYPNNNSVRTFSKQELIVLLKNVGLNDLDFYYPLPDYKFPMQVFSEQHLPKIGDIRDVMASYDQDRIILFDENIVYDGIIKNEKFDFFANSFLIVCGI